MSVCVAIPAIPPRKPQLARALSSVINQTHPVDQISVSMDYDRLGAAQNRNRAWRAADTEWVAFLDDDDEMDPHHIQTLVDHADATDADFVWSWHRILKYGQPSKDVLPRRQHIRSDMVPEMLEGANFIPVTTLIKRAVLEEVGGFPIPGSKEWSHKDCEDWGCWKRIAATGAKFAYTDQVTWTWHHWGWGNPNEPGNTSGQPDRW